MSSRANHPLLIASLATAAALMLAAPVSAQTLIFDSFETESTSTTFRSAASSCGTYIDVEQTHEVTHIAMRTDPQAAEFRMRFMIFEHLGDGGHTQLLLTEPKAFTDVGEAWYMSDPFGPITLEAGKQYDVGGIPDVEHHERYDQIATSQNGITSIVTNPNFGTLVGGTFDDPGVGGHAAADCATRIFTGGAEADFSCEFPGDGVEVRRGQACVLGEAPEDGVVFGRNDEARHCRMFAQTDSGYVRLLRHDTVNAGQNVIAYCRPLFHGPVSIEFEPSGDEIVAARVSAPEPVDAESDVTLP